MRARRQLPLPMLASLLSLLSLLSFLPGCNRAEPPLDLDAGAPTQKARIFMIELEDGNEADCDGEVVAVEVDLPAPARALEGSMEALLAAGRRHDSAGLYNALANSPLRIDRIERKGDAARIYLAGYLELGGECDSPRVLSQLTETATQFRDLRKAEFFLDGKPLRELLSGKG
jgi:sporulation and spore germination protein